MSDLLIGVLSALMATNQPAALSNLLHEKTGLVIPVRDPNDPTEREYRKLLEEDDAATAEVDEWIKSSQVEPGMDPAVARSLLRARIDQRFDKVRRAYQEFLERHPNHSEGRLAYGSFLNDLGEEAAAAVEWEKARELNPNEPAAWNNLANHFGHNGPIEKAFPYYEKAIELDPTQSLYYYNLATTVYLFRKAATAYYQIDERTLFRKAMDLYEKAVERDPNNFQLATDVAQTYYGIPVEKTGDPEKDRAAAQRHADEALAAWRRAMALAGDDVERQGILIHLARVNLLANRFDEAREHLKGVTNGIYDVSKDRLLKNIDKRIEKAAQDAAE